MAALPDLSPLLETHLRQSQTHWTIQLRSALSSLHQAQSQSVEFQDYGGAASASIELNPAQKAVEYARAMLKRVESEMRRREGSEAGSRRSSFDASVGLFR